MTTVTRRHVLKSGTALVGGMAGILAPGRAPAFAQGTTVHWLRWNDFVPASDQLLRKELLPAAEKDLGIKINLETVNGNDLQPRVTASVQSGSGPDLIMVFNNQSALYAESVVDLSDLAEEVSSREGGLYKYSRAVTSDGKKFNAMPWTIVGAMNAYRKSWFDEVGVTKFPETWDAYYDAGKKLKAKGHPPFVRRSADVRLSAAVVVRWQGGGSRREDGGDQQQEDDRLRQVHDGLLQGYLRRGRPGVGRHQQQPRIPVADHLVHAQWRVDLHRGAAQSGQVHHREGCTAQDRYPARASAQRTTGAVRSAHVLLAHADELLEEPKGREGPAEVGACARKLREVVHLAEGLRHTTDGTVGNPQAVERGSGDGPLQGRRQARPSPRLRRPRRQEGGRGADQVHHRRYVREGHPGRHGGGCREVGGERAQEDLHVNARAHRLHAAARWQSHVPGASR